MKKTLYLASQSESRKLLLVQARIPFTLIKQNADETISNPYMLLRQMLETLAVSKMEHAQVPPGDKVGQHCYVLTADTMGQDIDGAVYGKPSSRSEAIAMIKALRIGGVVGTAFCLDKKEWTGSFWDVKKRIIEFVSARYVFDMPDHWIDRYLENVPDYMKISGAIDVSEYGAQFLKSVDGSYGAITGLPLYELRIALKEIGFYE